MCSTGEFSQPFLSQKDNNWYTLAPGMSVDNVTGAGWELSGGAKLMSARLADGAIGTVLNLPSGSRAVSPTMCVTSEYPTARAEVRDLLGAEGVGFFVSYEGTNTWANPKNTGQIHGTELTWTAAGSVNLQPNNVAGWQRMRITLVPGGKLSDFQVYNLYLDPRMTH